MFVCFFQHRRCPCTLQVVEMRSQHAAHAHVHVIRHQQPPVAAVVQAGRGQPGSRTSQRGTYNRVSCPLSVAAGPDARYRPADSIFFRIR